MSIRARLNPPPDGTLDALKYDLVAILGSTNGDVSIPSEIDVYFYARLAHEDAMRRLTSAIRAAERTKANAEQAERDLTEYIRPMREAYRNQIAS